MANDASVHIMGNLTRDPETRTVGANKVTGFTVAVSTSEKKPDGTYNTNYYDVSLWGPRGESFCERAEKGTAVSVEGDLMLSEYISKKDNLPHQRLRVTANKVKITARAKERPAQGRSPVAAPMPDEDDMFA